MDAEKINELDRLSKQKEHVQSFLNENRNFLSPFIIKDRGVAKYHTLKSLKADYEATSTAFALFYLVSVLNSNNTGLLNSSITKQLELLISNNLGKLQTTFFDEHSEKRTTLTGILPNNYNTPIQLSGILATAIHKGIEIKGTRQKNLINKLIDSDIGFIKKLKSNHGYIGRIGFDNVPSPYLTFWVVTAIILYDTLNETKYLNKVYVDVTKWATDSLSKAISYSYSGLTQSFDAIEVTYLILILLSLLKHDNVSKSESSSIYNAKKLIEHSIRIIFSNHFSNGCFTKSLPVFADSNNFSLSCPTVEPISLLLIEHPEYFYTNSKELIEIFEWISESKFKSSPIMPWSWRSEWEHQSSKPTSFMSVSVFAYIAGFQRYLDLLLSKTSEDLLGVLPYFEDKDQSRIDYPEGLKEIVSNFVIKPIESGKKDLAHFSLILFGPPGTSKTTISKKIAQDLKWPLLIVNANTFLKSGLEKIDYEAERIFKLVSYLENVVILFDEVEELVLNRDSDQDLQTDQRSRLLTTSMLPRINDLRSSCRVVFIFATNYLNHIDNAISRTGRFDCVHCVMPPNSKERKNIIKSILGKNNINPTDKIWSILLNSISIKKTEKFCYSDIRDLIKRIIVRKDYLDEDIENIINSEIQVGSQATISDEIYNYFKEKKRIFDRPKSIDSK